MFHLNVIQDIIKHKTLLLSENKVCSCAPPLTLTNRQISAHFIEQLLIAYACPLVHFMTNVEQHCWIIWPTCFSCTAVAATLKQALALTLLAPLLLGSVDVVFELDADLPLVGLVPDEGVLQQLLSGRTLGVILHQAALDKAEELLRPVRLELNVMFEVDTRCSVTSPCVNMRDALTERIRIKLTIFWT